MARFMTDGAAAGFKQAIEAIEKGSSAEVVVAVRARARRHFLAHAAVAAVLAAAMLALTLWADTEFELWQILVLPMAAAALGVMIVEEIPPVYRALTPTAARDEHVREAARSQFYASGVHATQRRTGLLVFVAVREQDVELVPDVAIAAKLGDALEAMATKVAAAIPGGGEATARALASLADELADKLPRGANDVNELPDEVVASDLKPRGLRS